MNSACKRPLGQAEQKLNSGPLAEGDGKPRVFLRGWDLPESHWGQAFQRTFSDVAPVPLRFPVDGGSPHICSRKSMWSSCLFSIWSGSPGTSQFQRDGFFHRTWVFQWRLTLRSLIHFLLLMIGKTGEPLSFTQAVHWLFLPSVN